jgi:hypothetical protein
MTSDASFGPVFIVVAPLVPSRDKWNLNIMEIFGWYVKKMREKKNSIPVAQTTPDASFGPVFVVTTLLMPSREKWNENF